MCINIIPQNGIIQVGLHCQLDDIDDFRGFAAEKCRTEDFVAFSINNSLQVTGSAAKQASPGTGCFKDNTSNANVIISVETGELPIGLIIALIALVGLETVTLRYAVVLTKRQKRKINKDKK